MLRRSKSKGTVTGVIDGKFENAYLMTVMVGLEKLRGVLYEMAVVFSGEQFLQAPNCMNNSDNSSSTLHVITNLSKSCLLTKGLPNIILRATVNLFTRDAAILLGWAFRITQKTITRNFKYSSNFRNITEGIHAFCIIEFWKPVLTFCNKRLIVSSRILNHVEVHT